MTMNELDVLEELIDDDPFIRAYPSFRTYLREWSEVACKGSNETPAQIIFEFYAEKTPIPEALSIWEAYEEHI